MLRLLSSIFLLIGVATTAWSLDIEVKPDGSGDYPTIQAAVDAAEDGDVVLLWHGTYRGDGNRDVDFNGKAITVRSRSGKPRTCIIDSEGTPEEPHRGFLFHSGEGPESILEGVTVTGGYAPIALTVPAGGAINVTGSSDPLFFTSPTIRKCRFIDNDSPFAVGGVNFFISMGTISDCYFSGNRALSYDAAALGASGFSQVTVDRCVFEDNTSANRTGAFGSGFFEGDVSVTTFNDCVFRGNTAGYRIGGIGATYDATIIANRCLFEGNDALDSSGATGAGVRAALYFNECTFVGNSSNRGGVLGLIEEATAEFTNCTLYGNMAPEGSSMSIEDSSSLVVHNSVLSFGQGGATCYGTDAVTFSCTDIFGNEGGDWTGAIADQLGVDGNISLDPLFVNGPHGDFYLKKHSPCAPFSPPNGDCDLIGAWPVHGKPQAPWFTDGEPGGLMGQIPRGSFATSQARNEEKDGTRIGFTLTESVRAQITLFDASGRLVRDLVDETFPAGSHSVSWDTRDTDGRQVPSGIYFASLSVENDLVATRKVVILR